MKRYEEIIDHGMEWEKKYKADATFINKIGLALLASYRYKEAYEYFFKALNKKIDNADIAGNVILALKKMNKISEAYEFGIRWKEGKIACQHFEDELAKVKHLYK